VVVGGGSQGIGSGIAREAARRGAREVVLLARGPEALAATAAQIGAQATPYSVDLTDAGRVAEVCAQIRARSGVPDVVVASSASGRFLGLAESQPTDAVEAMASTYFAAFNLFRGFVADMRARGSGRFVVVGSPARALPFPAIAYKASRHALHGFAEGLREDLLGTGVGVTYVEPSRIKEGSYFARNPGVLERLPTVFRDPRFALLWQSEAEAGRMTADAIEADDDLASPAWLHLVTTLGAVAGDTMARLVLRW